MGDVSDPLQCPFFCLITLGVMLAIWATSLIVGATRWAYRSAPNEGASDFHLFIFYHYSPRRAFEGSLEVFTCHFGKYFMPGGGSKEYLQVYTSSCLQGVIVIIFHIHSPRRAFKRALQVFCCHVQIWDPRNTNGYTAGYTYQSGQGTPSGIPRGASGCLSEV